LLQQYSSSCAIVTAPNEHYNSTNKPFYTIHCYSNFKKNQPLQHRTVTAGWWMKFEKQAVIFFLQSVSYQILLLYCCPGLPRELLPKRGRCFLLRFSFFGVTEFAAVLATSTHRLPFFPFLFGAATTAAAAGGGGGRSLSLPWLLVVSSSLIPGTLSFPVVC
jgi:hypothetical protein